MEKNIAIVGAGASGLICAIFCAKNGLNVEVFEQNAKCGKKILVSGNGRCNITNTNLSSKDYFTQNHQFVEYALQEFGFNEFEKFVNSLGLLLLKLDDGRCYPLSNEAKSVVQIFQGYARSLGVTFHLNHKISNIQDLTNKFDSVVIATGSRAAPHLGGNSDGEEFAKEFGHSIIPSYPSLVQLHLSSKKVQKMSGVKQSAEVTLLINHKKVSVTNGDILFTNYGISGFAILDISQQASAALLNYESVNISVNLLPSFNAQQLSSHILKTASLMPRLTISDILVGLIPLKIVNGILEELHITSSLIAFDVQTKIAKKIANTILNWSFEVSKTHGFRHAEVSGGGINTSEINSKTMQSYKKNNLYFCGEVLDVVGKRGGYNFAWAWASGVITARDIMS